MLVANCKAGQPGEQTSETGSQAGRQISFSITCEGRRQKARWSSRGRLENTRRRLRLPSIVALSPSVHPYAVDSPSLGCLPRRSFLPVASERCSLRLGQSASSMALRAPARQRTQRVVTSPSCIYRGIHRVLSGVNPRANYGCRTTGLPDIPRIVSGQTKDYDSAKRAEEKRI